MTRDGSRVDHGAYWRATADRLSSIRRLVVGTCLGLGAVVWLASTALAAAPSPSAGAAGDPRSSGQGPGLVGDPGFALLAVAVIGVSSVLVTLAWVRLTGRRGT